MRSMNLIQLFGGVVVAGVVAAGTTAFTATGITKDAGLTGVSAGGAVSISASGPNVKLMTAALVQDATNLERITKVNISMMETDGTTPIVDATAPKIFAKFTGTGGNGTGAWLACSADSAGGTDDGGFTCLVAGGYYEIVTAVQIAYVP